MVDRWAVMMTQPNRERTAIDEAQKQGHEVWLPITRNARTHRTEPLFPRYAFVSIVSAWRHLLSTRGVSDVLRGGETPSWVPEEGEFGMAGLRARERDGLIVLPPRQRFLVGEPVRVEEGPFTGWIGLFDGMDAHRRVRVLLNILGSETPVNGLDERALSPA